MSRMQRTADRLKRIWDDYMVRQAINDAIHGAVQPNMFTDQDFDVYQSTLTIHRGPHRVPVAAFSVEQETIVEHTAILYLIYILLNRDPLSLMHVDLKNFSFPFF